MRNKLGLVQIKVRAKDSSTIDFSDIQYEDLTIDGKIEDAKGGKLVLLDILLVNSDNNYIEYQGVTKLVNERYISVIAYNENTPSACVFRLFADDVYVNEV